MKKLLLVGLLILISVNVFAGNVGSIQAGNVYKIPETSGFSLQGWNQDGSRIRTLNIVSDDYVEIDILTGGKHVLISGSRFQGLEWYGISPDQQKILFTKVGENALYVMNVDGTGIRKIWAEDFMDVDISSDSTRALFVARNPSYISKLTGASLMIDVVIVSLANGEVLGRFPVVNGQDLDGDPKGPAEIILSPDGSKIAFKGGIINADGTSFVSVPGLFPAYWTDDNRYVVSEGGCVFSKGGSEAFCKEWDSIDNTQADYFYYLLIERDEKETTYSAVKLYVTDINGANNKLILDTKSGLGFTASSLKISPDGKAIALQGADGIYIVDVVY